MPSDPSGAPDPYPRVRGICPMGCGETLFLGAGGYVTCSWIDCPDPAAASDLLAKQGGLFLCARDPSGLDNPGGEW